MRKALMWSVIIALILVVLGSMSYFSRNGEDLVKKGLEDKGVAVADLPMPDEEKTAEASKEDLIQVTALESGATIISPLAISGRARGYWYFEASFPIELRDSSDQVVTSTVAQASGDWMTEDFVDFTATLNFAPIGNASGTLVLKKDNPSGEPALDDQLVIPVIY